MPIVENVNPEPVDPVSAIITQMRKCSIADVRKMLEFYLKVHPHDFCAIEIFYFSINKPANDKALDQPIVIPGGMVS